jgi:hypothetical protein
MALVEGTDTYLSVAGADEYHAGLGHTAWAAATTEAKEIALRAATQYIDSRYRFVSAVLVANQPLEWPRLHYPWPQKRVLSSTAELALRALAGPLYVDVNGAERIKKETIGPITTEFAEAVNDGQVCYALVDDLLCPLLWVRTTTVRMVRA